MDVNKYISSGIIEMYVLGLCTKEEVQELESLRKEFPEINTAISDFELQYEQQLSDNAVMPDEKVDEKILQSFSHIYQKEIVQQNEKPLGKVVKPYWWRNVAAAAIILFLGSAIANYITLRKINQQQNEIAGIKSRSSITLSESDYQILNNPKITPVAMYGVGSHAICRCTMYLDKETGKLYVLVHHLAKRWSANSSYQLWTMVDNKPVNIGIIDDNIRGQFIELNNVPEQANSFFVSLESESKNVAMPSTDIYLHGEI